MASLMLAGMMWAVGLLCGKWPTKMSRATWLLTEVKVISFF